MKEAILQRTSRGFDIYAHVIYLRTGYVIKKKPTLTQPVVVPNPWDENRRSLVLRLRPTINNTIVMHKDESRMIEDGNAFDLARYHYGVSSEEVCQAINEDLKLHVGEEYSKEMGAYMPSAIEFSLSNRITQECPDASKKKFSYFKYPQTNVIPAVDATLAQVYRMIKGEFFRARTEAIRATTDRKERSRLKTETLCFCTFSGVFSRRGADYLEKHSGLMCIDFDHVEDLVKVKNILLTDGYFTTELMFTSPSGDGVKWVIDVPDDMTPERHSEYYDSICNYLDLTYGLKADRAAKDVARCCFLCWDPWCYINPSLIDK